MQGIHWYEQHCTTNFTVFRQLRVTYGSFHTQQHLSVGKALQARTGLIHNVMINIARRTSLSSVSSAYE
jgi:hypothetical protein